MAKRRHPSRTREIFRRPQPDFFELGWMYDTVHKDGRKARINYTVWSEVFSCPECAGEVVFLEEALDQKTKRVRDEFPCPACRTAIVDVAAKLPDAVIDEDNALFMYRDVARTRLGIA